MAGYSKTRLDHRVNLLSELAEHRIQSFMDAMQPPGAPKPLSMSFTSDEALPWWRKNRYTRAGQTAMQGMSLSDVMRIDAWLSRHPDPDLAGQPTP